MGWVPASVPGADGREFRVAHGADRFGADDGVGQPHAAQRLADVPQALEGHGGAAGRLAAVGDVAFEGVALGGIAAHAVADPAGFRADHELLVRLDEAGATRPAGLAVEGAQVFLPRLGELVVLELGENDADRQARGGDVLVQ